MCEGEAGTVAPPIVERPLGLAKRIRGEAAIAVFALPLTTSSSRLGLFCESVGADRLVSGRRVAKPVGVCLGATFGLGRRRFGFFYIFCKNFIKKRLAVLVKLTVYVKIVLEIVSRLFFLG